MRRLHDDRHEMPAAPLPPDETQRLAALHRYRLLDSSSEPSFDELVELAAQLCEAPIALVSLVDEGRQWFKAKVGIDAAETPREVAFCAHAILGEEPFVVEDARADARFADNPLVTGEPGIRFYAGAPLRTADGHALGALCVIDRRPRTLSPLQRGALATLARQVVAHAELRLAAAMLAQALDTERDLQKLLPICAWCKRVRTDDGYWHQVERYLAERTRTRPSHGICPDCAYKLERS